MAKNFTLKFTMAKNSLSIWLIKKKTTRKLWLYYRGKSTTVLLQWHFYPTKDGWWRKIKSYTLILLPSRTAFYSWNYSCGNGLLMKLWCRLRTKFVFIYLCGAPQKRNVSSLYVTRHKNTNFMCTSFHVC